MIQKLKKNDKGFTLVELIVVIAILGVLMAVLVPQYIQYVEKSRIAADESAVSELAHAIEIAIAEGPVYDGLTAADFTVAYTDNAATLVITGVVTNNTTLNDALVKVITLPINFKSKFHEGDTATITGTYSATTGSYKISAPVYTEKA